MSAGLPTAAGEAPPTSVPRFLACPNCHGALDETLGEDETLRCERCGIVGKWRLGCADFLAFDRELQGALDARLDLEHDADVAAQTWSRRGELADKELWDFGVRLLRGSSAEDPNAPGLKGLAVRRYERWYHCVACEVGDRAGDGTVVRANASLTSRGLPELPRGLAVEAGSGVGRHLPGLARHFDAVVCIDCCLTHLVLARAFVEEAGVSNVWFVRANVERLPLATGSADLVHQNGVIEHVADPQAMVAESLRITSEEGSFVCVSPNRYPITPEAHFKLPLFGVFPRRVRAWLLPYVRGVDSEVGTDLRSLRQINRYFAAAGTSRKHTFFVSPQTPTTVRRTLLRRIIVGGLSKPLTRRLVDFTLNRVLLPIAPYHVVVASKKVTTR